MAHTTDQIIPEVGMGATLGVGSDAYPYTIHKVSDDLKKIWVSADEHDIVGGPYKYGETSNYTYSNHNENNETRWTLFTLRKNGRYIRKGATINDRALQIGHRVYYQDPSF